MLLKRLSMISNLTAVQNKISDASSLVKKKKKLVKMKRNLLIMIRINILLFQNLISLRKKFLMQDQHEKI